MHPILQPQNAVTLPELYEHCVSAGTLRGDDAQRDVVKRLEALRLQFCAPAPAPTQGFFSRIFDSVPAANAPRSVYIWGDVGRGKSLLMDMFYKVAPLTEKRRIHFHAFMAEIHAGSHLFRQHHSGENPIEHVASHMAETYKLICLDELQVTDVADAMILTKLFETQLEKGVTFIITSNRPPDELYKGGLQREKFLSFVTLVQERMDVLNLDSLHDYRMQQIRAMQKVYFSPRDEEADKALRDAYRTLTDDAPRQAVMLDVQGRKLHVHESAGHVALFTFHELCEMPLGPSDYLAIALRFSVVLLSGIPKLSAEKRNESRRFVTLIDTLYDHRCKLICTADAPGAELYESGDGKFEFQRTVSRLAEMQSEGYLAEEHIG